MADAPPPKSVLVNNALSVPLVLRHPETFVPPVLVILVCVKVLLIPAYRSTDFDVHRNWLAITYHLPLSEWYFDDANGTTVHTLDYPPAFAWFEWFLSNVASPYFGLLPSDRCLALLPDNDNDPSEECVLFQRTTVILSDIVLWVGAWMACQAFHSKAKENAVRSFLLIVLNPGLLWLDNVHFQYNGMLLGILLASIGCLIQGDQVSKTTLAYDVYHLLGASLYALLLNFKHLYLPLAPIYFSYLLFKYCVDGAHLNASRFLTLAATTLVSLVLPWIPFLFDDRGASVQVFQILSRLFPFARGLVHDYWAANVWALFCMMDKVVRFLNARVDHFPLERLPEPSPLACAALLLFAILPACAVVAYRPTGTAFVQAVVYTSFSAFMLAYHVHEKAIMTALIPLTLLAHFGPSKCLPWRILLFVQTSLWGLLGLFPLLFRSYESIFKVFSFLVYVLGILPLSTATTQVGRIMRIGTVVFVIGIIGVLELLPIHDRWEFLPLMVTSVGCAFGLIGCWSGSAWLLLQTSE